MTEPVRFFEWDMDARKRILWERHGECNNCGQCCLRGGEILFDAADSSEVGVGVEAPDEEGVVIKVEKEQLEKVAVIEADALVAEPLLIREALDEALVALRPADFDTQNGGDMIRAAGHWHEVSTSEGDRRFFGNVRLEPREIEACPMYHPDTKLCGIHDQKKLICSTFPTAPKQIEAFDECSYTFVKVEEVPIDDAIVLLPEVQGDLRDSK